MSHHWTIVHISLHCVTSITAITYQTQTRKPRTTNACESFHSHFNSQFYTSHPDIFTFLEVLKSVQVSAELKQRSSLVDTAARPEKSYKQKMDFIKKYQEQYENDAITRKQYISKISSKAQPVML